MMAKSSLQNHPNSPDSSNRWLWMLRKRFDGLHVLQHAGMGGADIGNSVENSSQPSQLLT
jgi:hypothetical protein